VTDSQRTPPVVLGTVTLAKTRVFHVEGVSLRFANGVEVEYERLRSDAGMAVMIVPMLDNDTVLMIREYAAGVERYELALPKGRAEPGESVLEAANRELMEEVGYGARLLETLTSFTLAPSYLNHATQVVLARDLYKQKLTGDEPEEIEVVPWRLSRLSELLANPECTEARSIAALFLVRERLG